MYPPQNASKFGASMCSLISTPSEAEKPSNPLVRIVHKISDPYQEKRAGKVFDRAHYEMKATNKLLEEDVTMPPGEKAALVTIQDDISTLSRAYCRAKANRDGKACRKVLPRMEEEVTNLNEDRTASAKRGRERGRFNQAYTLISDRSMNTTLLTAPGRRVGRCETRVRVDVLRRTTTWLIGGHDRKRIHWLQGKKGSGKSTLLRWITDHFISTQLKMRSWVVPIAFDTPLNQAEPFVNHFLPTILHQLASRSAELKDILSRLCATLKQDDFFTNTPFPQQIRTLFAASLARVLAASNSAPVMIILDGVDECTDGALDCLFNFMDLALMSSGVPVYFMIASTDSYRVRQHLESSTFTGMVDINEVEDYPSAKAKAESWVPSDK